MVRSAVELATGTSEQFNGGSVEPPIEVFGVDPAPLGGGDDGGNSGGSGGGNDTPAPKRRGRKPGSKNGTSASGTKSAKNSGSVETVTRLLLLVHAGVAGLTKTPELNLEMGEAKILAEPVTEILDMFDLKPDPKFELLLSTIAACGIVYGPRVYNVRKRWEQEARERKARTVGQGQTNGTPVAQPVAAPQPAKTNGATPPQGGGEQPPIPPDYNPYYHGMAPNDTGGQF